MPKGVAEIVSDKIPFPEWKRVLLLAALALVSYGLLQNGRWVAGGADDAYYLSLAANLLRGRGYTWNGAPALLVTPGWPLVLAAALKVSPSFAFLNLLPLTLMTGAVLAWYVVLRRLTTPWRAFGIMAVCLIFFEWHRQSCSLFSDSLDFLLLAPALILALQIRDGQPAAWRIPLLGLTCAAMVVARYSGALMLPLVVGVILSGELRPRLNRQWLAAVVVALAMAGVFLGMRSMLHTYADECIQTASSPGEKAAIAADLKADDAREERSFLLYPRGSAGTSLVTLFWPPAAVLEPLPLERHFIEAAGWVLLLLFLAKAWQGLRQRQWLWAGTAVAVYILIDRPQHHTVPRYLAPMAPLIVLGIWGGVEYLVPPSRPAWLKKTAKVALAVFMASALAANTAILAVNVWAVRSPEFHKVWMAGEYEEVMRLGAALAGQRLQDGELAVAVKYDGVESRRSPKWIHRAACLLTDRTVQLVPTDLVTSHPSPKLLAWAQREKVRFIIGQPGGSVQRIWHIRLSEPPDPAGSDPAPTSYFVLYEVREDGFARVSLPEVSDGLRTVPGL